MRFIVPELSGIAFFVITGWVALWPARGVFGAVRYHLAALPTGLMAACIAVSVSSVTGRPLDIWSAIVGAVLLAAGVHLALRSLSPQADARHRVGPKSFLVTAAALVSAGAILSLARLTVISNDSVMTYWPLGMDLARTGAITVRAISSRALLLPAMNAIFADMGSGWAYVVYPMLAATVIGWMASTLVDGPLSRLKRPVAWSIAGLTTLALMLEPTFLYHALFVHSHMISGLYLMAAVTCLLMAAPPATEGQPSSPTVAYLVLAGIFAAGLSLARPDGLAYQFVPTAYAIALLTRTRVRARDVAAYFGPLATIVGVTFAATYLELGMWQSGKAGGAVILVMLAALAVTAVAPWIVARLNKLLPFDVAGDRFATLLLLASVVGTAAVLALKWKSASETLSTAWQNLFAGHGGYFLLWWGVLVLLSLSALTGDAMRRGSWTRPAFMSIALFFIIAAVVHSVGHVGRLGTGDSLNRIAFHTVPLIAWFVAATVGRVLARAE